MRKYIPILCILLCINMAGCGKIDNGSTSSVNSPAPTGIADNGQNTTLTPDNNKQENTTDTSGQGENTGDTEQSGNPEETPGDEAVNDETQIFNLSEDTPYRNTDHSIKILGLKEYKTLKSDLYVDKPGKGKKFLVLFLAVANNTQKDEYINVNSLTSKIDGKETSNSFLVNEPKNYSTIFTNIAAGERKAGFIVWEVPSGWKKFEMEYDGWTYTHNLSIKCEFTPDDLSDPPIYSEEVLY